MQTKLIFVIAICTFRHRQSLASRVFLKTKNSVVCAFPMSLKFLFFQMESFLSQFSIVDKYLNQDIEYVIYYGIYYVTFQM